MAARKPAAKRTMAGRARKALSDMERAVERAVKRVAKKF